MGDVGYIKLQMRPTLSGYVLLTNGSPFIYFTLSNADYFTQMLGDFTLVRMILLVEQKRLCVT